ncbi:helix-turn-helix domain-containing protein [Microbacterium sp. F51-2R]|uniref:helix-turn-helix domain-containing protein n=1 Tax=Microbacterium sp. F51-2R TaxID=3445777 RepID=UPI003FA07537
MSRTPNPSKGVGAQIRDARESRGWTQQVLAEKANVSRPTIARVETGNNISTRTLERVAHALGLNLDLK